MYRIVSRDANELGSVWNYEAPISVLVVVAGSGSDSESATWFRFRFRNLLNGSGFSSKIGTKIGPEKKDLNHHICFTNTQKIPQMI